MGKHDPNQRKRRAVLDAIVQQVMTPAGDVDLVQVLVQYEAYLNANPALLDSHGQAQRDIKTLDESRRPRSDGVQSTMFDPDAWLVTNEGVRTVMARMSQQQCMSALHYRTRAHLAEVADYNTELTYWNQRIPSFQPGDADLEAVERRVFGWQP